MSLLLFATMAPMFAGMILLGRAMPRSHKDGHLHCPRCGYHVRPDQEPPCPECGHVWKKASELRRTPVQWRRLAAAFPLLLTPVFFAFGHSLISEGGWTHFVPRRALEGRIERDAPASAIRAGQVLPTAPRNPRLFDRWAVMKHHRSMLDGLDAFAAMVEGWDGTADGRDSVCRAAREARAIVMRLTRDGFGQGTFWFVDEHIEGLRVRLRALDAERELPIGSWAGSILWSPPRPPGSTLPPVIAPPEVLMSFVEADSAWTQRIALTQWHETEPEAGRRILRALTESSDLSIRESAAAELKLVESRSARTRP